MHPIRHRNYLLLSRDASCYLCSKDMMVYPRSWIWYDDTLYHTWILESICFWLGSADPFWSACAAVLQLMHSMIHTVPFAGLSPETLWVALLTVECHSQLLIESRFSSLGVVVFAMGPVPAIICNCGKLFLSLQILLYWIWFECQLWLALWLTTFCRSRIILRVYWLCSHIVSV